MTSSPTKARITELDSLRGIAAFSVVIFHLFMQKKEAEHLHILGFLGVALFFIISGFVIFMTIENKPSVRLFVINRVSRLYPAYWFSVLFVTTLWFILSRGDVDWLTVLANMTMIQEWLSVKNMDATYWTLRVELCFYFLIVLLLVFGKPSHTVRCATTLFVIFYFLHLSHFLFPTTEAFYKSTLHLFPLIGSYGYFFSGILFYDLWKKKERKLLSLLILLACISLNLITLRDFGNVDLSDTSIWTYSGLIVLCYVLFTALIMDRLTWLSNPFLKFVGEISYSLYITHFYFSYCFLIPVLEARGIHWLAVRFITLLFVFLTAYFVNKKIEVPYMKRLRERLLLLFPSSIQ